MPLVYNQGSFILQFLHHLSSILSVDKLVSVNTKLVRKCPEHFFSERSNKVQLVFLCFCVSGLYDTQHNNKKWCTQNNIILSVVNTKCRYANCCCTEYFCYTVFTMGNVIKEPLITSTGSCHIIYLPWYLGHRDIYQKLLRHTRSRGKRSLRFSVKNASVRRQCELTLGV